MRRFLFFLLAAVYFYPAAAQSVNAPLNQDYYHFIDRYEILGGEIYPGFFTNWKPYMRNSIAVFADSLSRQEDLDKVDRFNMSYYQSDNWEWSQSPENISKKPFLKHFYRVNSDLYHVETKDFNLHINPVLQLSAGSASDTDDTPFINTRGAQIRGWIDNKLGFYGYIGENQVIFPGYVRDRIDETLTVPGEGFWKEYKDTGVDFLTARGYISFNATRHVNIQFGHDRFRVGNGYRSMILSDFGPAYTFMKFEAQVWKMKYTMLVSELTAEIQGNRSGLTGTGEFPNKWLAFHHLTINIGRKFNIGLFESVIYGPEEVGESRGFELKYLNPIIFYRALEQQDGSTDNVLLGMDFKWLPLKRLSLYGQFMLDELVIDDLKEGNGWWGNKFGAQLGMEYINMFGIDHLDLQLEGNLSRPYNYSHGSPYGSYSHYRQPLAHPRGSNFSEFIGILRYQPAPRWYVTAKMIYSDYGLDTLDSNWGGNILLDNTTREMNYGNKIGQGVSTQQLFADIRLSYMWKHNFFIEAHHTFRNVESEYDPYSLRSNVTELTVRWNIPARLSEF